MPYDLPSWLQAEAPSEPFKALLAGVQAGSTIKANNLRAAALAEEQRQFNEIQPLRNKLAQQQFEIGRIHLENEVKKQQDQIDSERAFTKVSDLFSRHQALGIAGTDGSEAAVRHLMANNTNFYLHPGAKDLMTSMFLSKKTLTVDQQHATEDISRMERLMTQQSEISAREAAKTAGKEVVANIRSDAEVEKANIRAEASARSLLNTKEFQTFMARKQAIVSDATMSLDKKFDAIKALEEQYNVTHKTDEGTHTTGAAPAVVPVPVTRARAGPEIRPDVAPATVPGGTSYPMPTTQAEFDALPRGWFKNPKDGKLLWKD